MTRERPYDPDRPHLSAQTPDDQGFMNPQTLSAVAENQLLKHELAKEKGLRRQVMEDHYDSRSDEEIALNFIDREVEDTREFLNSDEGEDFLRRDITRHYAQGDAAYDPVEVFARPQRDRLRREFEGFYPPDSEE